MSSEQEPEEVPRVENSAEVYETWRRFKNIYDKNRFVIENRWIKMSKLWQREVLNKNWISTGDSGSPMPTEHRPDLT